MIATHAELVALCTRLRSVPRFALDTEAASFHRYVDRVYLLQISSDEETALIDPLSVPDLGPIGAVLADQDVEVVVHDADYDLRVLDRDYGFRGRNLFDTRIAAQLAGEESVGLGSLLEKHFGVALDKRFQRADWSRRPLPEDMAAYAAADVQYLIRLRHILADRLLALARFDWALEEFRHLEDLRWTGRRSDDPLRIKGAKALSPRQLAIFQEVHAWREATARELDRAPFRVIGNAALLAIARRAPQSQGALEDVEHVSSSMVSRWGSAILAAVEAGMTTPMEDLPRPKRTRPAVPDPRYEARLERLKQLRNTRAESNHMDPGLLCPNGTLQAIARAAPSSASELRRVAELRAWQREVLGEAAILSAAQITQN